MNEFQDIYYSIDSVPEPSIFKDRKSKFIGYAYPIHKIENIKEIISQLKKEHHGARHWCYGYRIGIEQINERANDDGEPSNSAGMPILGQIKAKNLTNILVVVVRYFGGVKLGVGGLMNAYKTAAKMVLDEAEIIEKIRTEDLVIHFKYEDMNKVMRIIKEQKLNIKEQKLEAMGKIVLSIRLDDYKQIKEIFKLIHTIEVK